METSDPSLRHLLRRLELLAARVSSLVAHRRAQDTAPEDSFRGLYLTAHHIDRLLDRKPATTLPDDGEALAALEAEAAQLELTGGTVRLRRLARIFELDTRHIDILLVALAPDLDSRFEALYGYLLDDITKRRATVGLTLELIGCTTTDGAARAAMRPGSPLIDSGLLVVEESLRPALCRPLRVPDRLVMHLLGEDTPDPAVAKLLAEAPPWVGGDPRPLSMAINHRSRLAYVREPRGSGTACGLAARAYADIGIPALVIDLERFTSSDDLATVFSAVTLEARLLGAGLIAGPVEALAEHGTGPVHDLTAIPWPLVLTGHSAWDPRWSDDVPTVVDAPAAGPTERNALWQAALNGYVTPELDPSTVTASFRLGPRQIVRAALGAWLQAELAGRPVRSAELRAGARAQNASGLGRLAHRVEPRVGFASLVVSAETLMLLAELVSRVRCRDQVLDKWQLRESGRRGDGVNALFTGPPGTGKTMGAEVVAFELGLDLYAVDLATVIDKYIGETEKNFDRIFTEAEQVNGVLFFDEADALFGKRSDVKDSHDRYANVEVAYLLQRMEAFNGISILATNLRSNVDDAFIRRLDLVVEFPAPNEHSGSGCGSASWRPFP